MRASPHSTFTVDNLGLSMEYDNSNQGLLKFLYSLIDYQILQEMGTHTNLNYIRKNVPYGLTTQFLRRGVPNDKTLHKLLYDYVYNEITYPIFLSNFYHDPHIPNNYPTRAVIEQNGRDYAENESNLLFNYLMDALIFIQTAGLSAVIDTNEYVKGIKQDPLISRKDLLLLCLTQGSLPSTRTPVMDMNYIVNNIKGYIDKTSEFESVVYANANSLMYNGDRIYPQKNWLWSGKKKTRHRGMDGVSVNVNDPFIVTNERTGETCELMYPRDYARDPSGANTVNCGCDVFYPENKELQKWLT